MKVTLPERVFMSIREVKNVDKTLLAFANIWLSMCGCMKGEAPGFEGEAREPRLGDEIPPSGIHRGTEKRAHYREIGTDACQRRTPQSWIGPLRPGR